MSRAVRTAGVFVIIAISFGTFVSGAHYNTGTESIQFNPILGIGLLALLVGAWFFGD